MRAVGLAGLLAAGLLTAAGSLTAQNGVAIGDLPPVGYGSFNQEQISVRFTAPDLEIRFLPLDERLLRLLANDAYASLHGLVEERKPVIDSLARREGISAPGLVLVSYFATRAAARFEPENLNLLWRGQLQRPTAILPYTSNFSSRQLGVRQQASAIYIFSQPLPVFEEFSITYANVSSTAWKEALPRIERERSRAVARWQAARERGDSTTGTP